MTNQHHTPSYLGDDKPREHCGVFGVFDDNEAALTVARGLHALQHRGQEAVGIVVHDGTRLRQQRYPGLVVARMFRESTINSLPGRNAIGHVRYSTFGSNAISSIQPISADLAGEQVAICHNGQFNNGSRVREDLKRRGAIFRSTSDTENILHLMAHSTEPTFVGRFASAVKQVSGGYALLAMTADTLIGARDPLGIRPLVIGCIPPRHINGSGDSHSNNAHPPAPNGSRHGASGGRDMPPANYVLASETCALETTDAQFCREVMPGEIVVIDKNGLRSFNPFHEKPPKRARVCAFEYIYFSRPDSVIEGKSVYQCRVAIGHQLAKDCPVHNGADVVVPVLDSGLPAALGFANASGIPFELGIVRNHYYVGRTFIKPSQDLRSRGVDLKHNANPAVVRGKRVVLVDDSIVRSTTSQKLCALMRKAGAREVHFRIASPKIRHVDCYGIDIQEPENLLAARMVDGRYINDQEIAAEIGAQSVGFVSVDGLYRALGFPEGRDNQTPQLTDHYFTGDYPAGLPENLAPREPSYEAPLFSQLEEMGMGLQGEGY